MPSRRQLASWCAMLVMFAGTSIGAPAQEYPAKPVTFFVPFAAGSATDTLARSLGQGVTAETRQNVLIDMMITDVVTGLPQVQAGIEPE